MINSTTETENLPGAIALAGIAFVTMFLVTFIVALNIMNDILRFALAGFAPGILASYQR